MQCDECGRDFRPARDWQHFCSPRCRNAYHNRENSRAAYAAEVAKHEARVNGHAPPKDDLVAQLELLKPAAPTVWRRPLVQPKSDEGEDQQVA
jgi:hypothetical protein